MNEVVDELDESDFEDSEDDLMDTWTLIVTLRQTGNYGEDDTEERDEERGGRKRIAEDKNIYVGANWRLGMMILLRSLTLFLSTLLSLAVWRP